MLLGGGYGQDGNKICHIHFGKILGGMVPPPMGFEALFHAAVKARSPDANKAPAAQIKAAKPSFGAIEQVMCR
ncbi:MAG: hypothetical protein ACKPB8_02785, partial [Alphaproteobacteria bacterium]